MKEPWDEEQYCSVLARAVIAWSQELINLMLIRQALVTPSWKTICLEKYFFNSLSCRAAIALFGQQVAHVKYLDWRLISTSNIQDSIDNIVIKDHMTVEEQCNSIVAYTVATKFDVKVVHRELSHMFIICSTFTTSSFWNNVTFNKYNRVLTKLGE